MIHIRRKIVNRTNSEMQNLKIAITILLKSMDIITTITMEKDLKEK